jgi:glycerol-3-phosphate O-acyltransferase
LALTLPRNPMQFFWWLRKILLLWVKPKVVPDNPNDELQLQPGEPVCYFLNSSSISDTFVLDEVCRRQKLPLPHNTRAALAMRGSASYIYLQRIGLVQLTREGPKEPPSPLLKITEMALADKSMEVKIVPVSVFWGRAPAKTERSLFKLLFFDDEHAGMLQKFFIILAQGRNTLVHFGKPISLRAVVDEGAGAAETAKKIRRVVRVHFRRQRNAATGPSLPSRNDVIASLVKTKAVKNAILDEARKKKLSLERAEARARRYLAEIACDMKPSVVRSLDILLTWMWNRMFDGVEFVHANRLREVEAGAEIVYLPSHRSHLDYMLLSYSLYYQGMWVPHTAAGVNLNFWPVGPLLRRAGAFYLRRSFGGNRLYTAVFNEYMHYLLTKGYSMNFFIEGGRSRTGRLLQPKTGMLTMVVQSFLRNSDRPIVFLPTYIGYDKVMEVRTYQSELRGRAKRKETVGGLLRARGALRTRFGRAYISIGEPIRLDTFLDAERPGWRSELPPADEKPRWLSPVVHKLAKESLTRVNSAAVLNPVALFALVILSAPQRAMAEDELIYLMDKLVRLLRATAYGPDVTLPEQDPREMLRYVMQVAKVERFQHPGGDVIFLEEREGVLLTYYRNNILHLVALPSLVASFFQHNDRMDEDSVRQACAAIYPFLRFEFFLRWSPDELDAVLGGVIDALVQEGLLLREAGTRMITRPNFTAKEFASLKVLSRPLSQTLERYAISTALLAKHGDGQPFSRGEYETTCQLMAQRVSILSGMTEPEFFEKTLFKNYVDLLKELDFAREEEGGKLVLNRQVGTMAEVAMKLLSTDVRQSIARASQSDLPLEAGKGS